MSSEARPKFAESDAYITELMREARALPFKDSERFTKFLATNAQKLFFGS